MKRVSLAALTGFALIGAAACQDALTSPQLAADARYEREAGNPPPPPIDTGATGSFFATETETFFQTLSNFSIPVTYMFNKTGNSGFLHFSSDDANGVDASSNGMVKFNAPADFSGKGTVEIQTDEGLLVIDLESVNDALSFFAPCGGESSCFHVVFDHATLFPPEGPPIEGTAVIDPGCPPDNESCFEEIG